MRKSKKFLRWSMVLISAILLSTPICASATLYVPSSDVNMNSEEKAVYLLPDGTKWDTEVDGPFIQGLEEFQAKQPYTVRLGRPVKVLPGTVYYASADYGGSGGHGVIGNEYTQGDLYVLGYALLGEDQRISDCYARTRNQIAELEESIYFTYADDEVKSIMVGLYTDEYANGAIGWVPANTTDIPGSDYFEQLLELTPEDDEQNRNENLEPDMEDPAADAEASLETRIPVDTELNEPGPKTTPDHRVTEPSDGSVTDNDIDDDYSFWQLLGDLFWAILKAIGYLILLLFLAYLMAILVAVAVAAVIELAAILLAAIFGVSSVVYATIMAGLCTVLSLIESIIPETRFLIEKIYDDHKKRVQKAGSEDALLQKFRHHRFVIRDYRNQPERQTFRKFSPKVTYEDEDSLMASKQGLDARRFHEPQVGCARAVAEYGGNANLDNVSDASAEDENGSDEEKGCQTCVVTFVAHEAQYPDDWVAAWIVADED